MAKDKFSIEDEYSEANGGQNAETTDEQEVEEGIEFSAAQLSDMRSYKDAGDYEGLGKYVSELI